MRRLKINPTVVSGDGGYIARTIARSMLASAPITAWTQFYHKPYCLDDWVEARAKAKQRCINKAIVCDNVIANA